MVQVRMCEEHGIEASGREGKVLAVVDNLVGASLEEPTVDEHTRLGGLKEELRARDAADRAEEAQPHGRQR